MSAELSGNGAAGIDGKPSSSPSSLYTTYIYSSAAAPRSEGPASGLPSHGGHAPSHGKEPVTCAIDISGGGAFGAGAAFPARDPPVSLRASALRAVVLRLLCVNPRDMLARESC